MRKKFVKRSSKELTKELDKLFRPRLWSKWKQLEWQLANIVLSTTTKVGSRKGRIERSNSVLSPTSGKKWLAMAAREVAEQTITPPRTPPRAPPKERTPPGAPKRPKRQRQCWFTEAKCPHAHCRFLHDDNQEVVMVPFQVIEEAIHGVKEWENRIVKIGGMGEQNMMRVTIGR